MDLPVPDLNFSNTEVNEIPNGPIPYITMEELLQKVGNGKIPKYMDCRFIYEFKGGHIIGAINITTIDALEKYYDLFLKIIEKNVSPDDLIIAFHCEFSQERSVLFAQIFKEIDRRHHLYDYPNVSFPNVYIIYGGFKKIYQEHKEICTGSYVEMRDPKHVQNRDLQKCNENYQNQRKLYSQRKSAMGVSLSMPL